MNKKIISGVIAASIIVGSIPIAALADTQSNNSDSTVAVQSGVNSTSTTEASVTVNTTNEKDSSSTVYSNSENTTTQITTIKNSTSNQNEENLVATTGSAITVDDTEPVKIEIEIKGTATVGQTVSDKVTGYNAEGQKIVLNENDLRYKWFADGKQMGTSKDLIITEDMDGEKIDCQVSYDDGKEGSK